MNNLYPTPEALSALFTDEVTRQGGSVHSAVESGGNLFLRATFPTSRDVTPGDAIQHGLAARTRGEAVIVHPYTFRQICQNGAIHVKQITSRSIERTPEPALEFGVGEQFREAIRAGSSPDILAENVGQMRDALSREVMLPLMIGMMMRRLRHPDLFTRIFRTFEADGDRSTYGLMNAVTAVARVEPDPERKWDLEELGGGILLMRHPAPRVPGGAKEDTLDAPTRARILEDAPVLQQPRKAGRRELVEKE